MIGTLPVSTNEPLLITSPLIVLSEPAANVSVAGPAIFTLPVTFHEVVCAFTAKLPFVTVKLPFMVVTPLPDIATPHGSSNSKFPKLGAATAAAIT